jgi:hypothetical protein
MWTSALATSGEPGRERSSAPPAADVIGAREVWRREKLSLQLTADSVHGSGADLDASSRFADHRVGPGGERRPATP